MLLHVLFNGFIQKGEMMKSRLISLILAVVFTLGILINPANAAVLKKVYTTNYPPLSVPAGLSGTGLAYKVTEELMKRADVDIPIEFGQWKDVYNKVLSIRNTAIFPIVMTADRRDDFIWIGPIAALDYYIYKPRGSNLKINNMNDIRNAKSVATVNGYVVNQILTDSGCRNLHYYSNPEQAINETLNGNNSLAIFPKAVLIAMLKRMGKENSKDRLIAVHKFMERNQYYALNKSTPAAVAINLQKALLKMQADGTIKKMYKRYLPEGRLPKIRKMPVFPKNVKIEKATVIKKKTPVIKKVEKEVIINPGDNKITVVKKVTIKPTEKEVLVVNKRGAAVPTIKSDIIERQTTKSKVVTKEGLVVSGPKKIGKMKIYAEEFAPFTFSKDGGNYVQGAVAEIVSAIQKELGQTPQPITISEWNSIYIIAKDTPYSALLTVKRIPERENDFYWIGPYAADSAWLYARRDSPLVINTIGEAKQIPAIACVGGAFAGTVLSQLGFNNLMPYSVPSEAVNDIVNFPEHAGAFSSINAPYLFRDAGFSAINMKPLIQVSKKTNYYIGISKSTPAYVAKSWQSAFEILKQRGIIKRILDRWIH